MRRIKSCTLGSVERSLETLTFRLVETCHGRGLQLDRHGHVHAGITFVSRGGYREWCDGREVECRSGMLVFKPPECVHSNHYGPSGAHALHLEIIDDDWLDHRVRLPEKTIAITDVRAGYLAAALAREFQLDDAVSTLTVDALGMELISLVFRNQCSSASNSAPGWVQRSTEFLRHHLHEVPSLRDVADQVNLPRRKVSQEFRRWVGCSIGQFVRRMRLENAVNKLRDSNGSIAAIADECGFSDQSHFTRVFKLEFGVTPATYRRLVRTTQSG